MEQTCYRLELVFEYDGRTVSIYNVFMQSNNNEALLNLLNYVDYIWDVTDYETTKSKLVTKKPIPVGLEELWEHSKNMHPMFMLFQYNAQSYHSSKYK